MNEKIKTKQEIGQELSDAISNLDDEELSKYVAQKGVRCFGEEYQIKLFDIIEEIMIKNKYGDCSDCEAMIAMERKLEQPRGLH